MSEAWVKSKAERANRRAGLPKQNRDDLGLVIRRDGSRQWDTWRAWAIAREMNDLGHDLNAVLSSRTMRGGPTKAIRALNP